MIRTAKARLARVSAILGPFARRISGGLGRVLHALATFVWRHREIANAILVRALWWGALVAWWAAAVPLVGGGEIDVERALVVFAAGATVCALVVALGRATRLRWWGGVLGSVHGMCGVAIWLVANG